MRYSGYRSMEKRIAASDSGGMFERWKYGCTLLADKTKVTANGHLKTGVLVRLIDEAYKAGAKINEREIQRRLQAARTYPSDTQFRLAIDGIGTWSDLYNAGFPQVEVTDPGEPYDPRTPAQRQSDADHAAMEQLKKIKTGQPGLPEVEEFLAQWNPPYHFTFHGDEHGPRSPLGDLYAVCDDSERYTSGMVKFDAERRAYLDERKGAVGGDLTKTWGEAEMRLRQLKGIGVSSVDSALEILNDFFRLTETSEGTDLEDEEGE